MTNEHNIESQFNACMHKEYCLSLKAQIRPLDENALAHTINMMPWRTDELGPQLREFAAQLWLQFCSVQAAATAPASTQGKPFGYFRAEPFGWTDCAATDEGAIALYERPAAPAVPQGWKLVPVEPTQEMVDAAFDAMPLRPLEGKIRTHYRAMLAAAPAAPSEPVTLTDDEARAIYARTMLSLLEETKGVIGGPDVVALEMPTRFASAIIAALCEKESKP